MGGLVGEDDPPPEGLSVPYVCGLTITRSAGFRSAEPVRPVVTAAMPR